MPKDAYTVAVGKRLRRYREVMRPGMGQEEYVQGLRISKTAYNNYERGSRMIPPDIVGKLKHAHGITFEWTYGGDASTLPWIVAGKLLADN